jgi:HK97 family phage prohead protease
MSEETNVNVEPTLLVRKFEASIVGSEDGDGRTVEGLVIPYGRRARVADPPDFTPYDEEIMQGAFRSSVKAPNRVLLDFEHYGATSDAMGSMGSITGTLGWGVALEERADGLFGRFRIGQHSDGDKALELIHAGVLTGFSAAMKPLRSLRTAAGVMQRVRVHLDRVSLCRIPAYEEAQVLAVRTSVLFTAEALAPFDPKLAEGIARLGLEVPEQLRAAAGE